jgi:hypothetical protein
MQDEVLSFAEGGCRKRSPSRARWRLNARELEQAERAALNIVTEFMVGERQNAYSTQS